MSAQQPQVFISYQRADDLFARQVREQLVSHGLTTWMDQYDIPVGAYWPDEIDKGLGGSDIVVGILSPDAVESRNVKNEWDWAIQNDKRLLLLQYRPCVIPHRYVSINFIDASGHDPVSAFGSLLAALGLAGEVDPPATPSQPIRHSTRRLARRFPVEPRLAGREDERERVRAAFDATLADRGQLLLLGGEAGIGKSALTSWLGWLAEEHRAVVLTGGCYDLTTTPPYGPWLEILRAWPEQDGAPPVPEALRGGEAMAQLASQAALFELAADFLIAGSEWRPLVLVLEDLHWTDQATVDLLRHLVRPGSGARMLLVATYRDDEITRRHPLYPLLPGLAREPNATRLILQRLDEGGLHELVVARYPLSPDDVNRLVDYLGRQTEGNPFFSGEVLAALVEGSTIVRDGDGWRVTNLDRVQVPDLVLQVIERRLAQLGDDAQRHLGVAAVIGHETPVDLWVEISGASEDALSETLDRAAEARIVEELRGGAGFRFTHALIRETLYEGIGLLRRRSLHRQVGEALAAGRQPDPDAVAFQFRQAGDDRAFDWLIKAGDRALRSYAWQIAAERYEQAASVIADDRERAREYGWLLINVASMLRYADTPRAISLIEQAASVGTSIGDAWLALSPLVDAGYYRVRLGDMRDGVDRMVAVGIEMEAAARDGRLASCEPPEDLAMDAKPAYDYMLRMAGERPDQAVVLDRSLAVIHLVNTGRICEAQELAEQLAVVWPPDIEETQRITFGGDWRSMYADLYFGLADIDRRLGLPQQSLQSAQTALSSYALIPHYFVMAWCYNRMLQTVIAYQTEEIELRRALANDAADAASRARGAVRSDASPDLFRTLLWIVEGSWNDAYSILRACEFPRDRSSRLILVEDYALSDLVVICAWQGRRDEALDLIRSALPDGPNTQPGNQPFESALILHAIAASLALDDGDLPTAHAWLAAHDNWLEWSGAVLGQVEGHLGWARYHRRTGDLAAAEGQARTALAKASDPRQPLCVIASHRLLGELATERGAYDDARDHLDQALTLADACAAPYERALTLIALAELDILTSMAAGEQLDEARAICERLEARPALERIAALEVR